MSKRSRRRRKHRERHLQLVCVDRNDWRTIYRVQAQPQVSQPPVAWPTGSHMDRLLRSLGWSDQDEPPVEASPSDLAGGEATGPSSDGRNLGV